ncbi:DUF3322 domain-containing protein [Pseudactinotalea sp. Z1748]|uniref:DUF3322 domain-containing protein n=1 Tax=Pseudactinotalea sp. Z1748 TaxID=3413027 RepID=UPI003C7B1EEC
MDTATKSSRYLRQIDAPGVNTKFVEARRGALAKSSRHVAYLHGLGLATKTGVCGRGSPAASARAR